ncbi:uncharacterized protein LOC5516638 isoform X2 [Nematostella vectensis]|nr:uncharacterized protein LOC5516638 isoform X2 [Nematostella vectensis]
MYEGDIFLTKGMEGPADLSSAGDVDEDLSLRSKRNAVRDRKRLWTNKIIPYQFESGFPNDLRPTILEAMEEYHKKTCLRFKERTDERYFLRFVNKKGCWSSVGRSYWVEDVGQEVSLGSGCNDKKIIMHELMHAIGFWHEQSRPDRNKYVEVLWENIQEGEAHNFNKYSHGEIDTLQVPYDFDSIMHYGRTSFGKDGLETIRAIHDPGRELGRVIPAFTELDLREINALYNCRPDAGSGWSVWSDYSPCDIYCHKYKQRFCSSANRSTDCPESDDYGVQTIDVACSHEECNAPVDGHWGRWSSWSSCSKTCGPGVMTRTRKCDDPRPRRGGKDCVGESNGNGICKVRSCGIGPDDCEFDADGMCHWTNSESNPPHYNWERKQGTTPSGGTGPQGDHTSGTGHYIFTESSGPNGPGFKSHLLSKTFKATGGRCLSFWYNMNGGSAVGSLNVYLANRASLSLVWSKTGNQGSDWKIGHVTIKSTSEYKIVFESVRGADFLSDIALDDVRFDDAPCVEAVGCYRDSGYNRAFPVYYADLRPEIDWYNMKATIMKCALLAEKFSMKVFGVQYYGECWGSREPKVKYNKFGADPDRCWSGVGKHFANFVYKIV